VLGPVQAPWWVAGGWALDLHLGKVTRAHKDLDIGILRKDAAIVLAALPGWEFFEAKDGVLAEIVDGRAPRVEVNSLWCKQTNAQHWQMEFVLDDSAGECWIFRRDRGITCALSKAIRRNAEGMAYLAPEIQLLYKARAPRPEDQVDFRQVAPQLDRNAQNWLREALMRTHPEHPWISMLKALS